MRKILIASLVVAGIGFVGASAAPVNNTVLQQLTDMKSTVTQVGWHNPWRSRWRRHWHCGYYSRWCN